MEYIVDDEYKALVRKYNWHNCHGYLKTNWNCKHGRTLICMHKLVIFQHCGLDFLCPCDTFLADNGLEIDHENHNRRDNRIDNLQIIYKCLNSSKQNHTNSSQYIGVRWQKQRNKWQARCNLNGKPNHLGCFDSETDAARAYDKFVIENKLPYKVLNKIPKIAISIKLKQ